MIFISTRGTQKATGAQAIIQGLAGDNGLFVPEKFPQVTAEEMQQMAEMSYSERAAFIVKKYFDEFDEEFLQDACAKAYASFEGDDPVPLVKIDGDTYILELYRGPTCAFTDISMTLLPYLIKESCRVQGIKENILLLSSTSGDTGKAAMESFRDVENTKVAVFYPDEGVSKMQRLQLCAQDGNNVFVSAVKGNFDDCQKAVKNLFASQELRDQLKAKGTLLTCANCTNVGRLIPQIAYYFSAYLDLLTSNQMEYGEQIDFVVPTGNFGNILAGWYAKQMGLPIRKLVCASNRNRALADFFRKGTYDVKRGLHRSMSPSMDVLFATNVERLLFEISGRNASLTAQRMQALADKKECSITTAEKAKLDKDFFAGHASEDDTVEAMYDVFDEYGYAMDTHTGVGIAVYNEYKEKLDKKDARLTVLLATANPYKLPQDVLYALSGNDVKDSFKGIKRLNLLTAMKPPKSLLALRYRPLRFKGVVDSSVQKMSALLLDLVDGKIVPVPDQE